MNPSTWFQDTMGREHLGYAHGVSDRGEKRGECACPDRATAFRRGAPEYRCANCGGRRGDPTTMRTEDAAGLLRLSDGDVDRLAELLRSSERGRRILRRLVLATWRGTA